MKIRKPRDSVFEKKREEIIDEIDTLLDNNPDASFAVDAYSDPEVLEETFEEEEEDTDQYEILKSYVSGVHLICRKLLELVKICDSKITNLSEDELVTRTVLIAHEINFAIYREYRRRLKKMIYDTLKYRLPPREAIERKRDPEKYLKILDYLETKLFTGVIVTELISTKKVLEKHNLAISYERVWKQLTSENYVEDLLKFIRKVSPDLRANRHLIRDICLFTDWNARDVREIIEFLFDILDLDTDDMPKIRKNDNLIDAAAVYKGSLNVDTLEIVSNVIEINTAELRTLPRKEALNTIIHEFVHFLQLYLFRDQFVVTHGPEFDRAVDELTDAIAPSQL